jgi:membrane-bound serine protease (ClpP class)
MQTFGRSMFSILALAAASMLTGWSAVAPTSEAAPLIVRVSIDGPVHPVTAEIVGDAIIQAQKQGARLILIRLNTPGGLLEATREIVEKIVASPVPVAAYVTPSGGRAASAGFFVLQAADIAAMAPGTNTGAASPVLMGQTMDPVLRNKAENDLAALLRSLTVRRGRNSELAEKAVREAKAFSDVEAMNDRLIDLLADNESQLVDKLNGHEVNRFSGAKQTLRLTGARFQDVHLSWREEIVKLIADPNIGFILLVLGIFGIYVEFSSPGLIFPGVAGTVALVLGLSSLAVLPINWAGAALLLLAIAFFVLEAKFASHGVLGVGGAIAMTIGAVILLNGPPEMRIHWITALSVALPFMILSIFLMSMALKTRQSRVLTGISALLDEVGTARTSLTPCGQVFIHGEYWRAVGSANINSGSQVRVRRVEGLTLYVDPLPDNDTANPPANS